MSWLHCKQRLLSLFFKPSKSKVEPDAKLFGNVLHMVIFALRNGERGKVREIMIRLNEANCQRILSALDHVDRRIVLTIMAAPERGVKAK